MRGTLLSTPDLNPRRKLASLRHTYLLFPQNRLLRKQKASSILHFEFCIHDAFCISERRNHRASGIIPQVAAAEL